MVRIETVRALHEDIESLESAGALVFMDQSSKSRRITRDHAILYLSKQIEERVAELSRFYNDDDAVRTDEIRFLGGGTAKSVWDAFYDRVNNIKGSSRRSYPYESIGAGFDSQYWYSEAHRITKEAESLFSGRRHAASTLISQQST